MRNYFTEEDITELSNNLYTYKVSKTTIKFTDQFYNDFWKLYVDELPNRDILTKLGYNPSVLGIKRIEGIVAKLRKERLTDGQRLQAINKSAKVRMPPVDTKYSEMKSQDAIKAMEAELTYLRQEVEFLKKISQLEKQKKREE
jgi:hypothetical protein